MLRIYTTALLIIWSLTAAFQSSAQSGSVVPIEPVTLDQKVSGASLIRGIEGQAALNTNVARVLAPDFEPVGDVTIVGAPVKDGDSLLLSTRVQALLRVPIRFRHAATLDADVRLKADTLDANIGPYDVIRLYDIVVARGTWMYRQFLPQAPGMMIGYEHWCGRGATIYNGSADPGIFCFDRAVGDAGQLYSMSMAHSNAPFYTPPYDFSVDSSGPDDGYPRSQRYYDVPFPAMTVTAQAPVDMVAELQVEHFNDGDEFSWVVKKSDEQVELGDKGSPRHKAVRSEGNKSIFRLGWLDIVFSHVDERLEYEGYIDLTSTSALAARAVRHDAQMKGGVPEVIHAWRLGALDIEPGSLALSVAEGMGTLRLKGKLHAKVRLIEGTKPITLSDVKANPLGEAGFYEAGEIFYATVLDRTYLNGQPYFLTGWCGAVHKVPGWGRDMKPSWQTCFSPDDASTASLMDDESNVWETRSTPHFSTGYKFPRDLPKYEPVAAGPEDARDLVMRIGLDPQRDPEGDYVFVTLAVQDASGEREQRIWCGAFDEAGNAVLNLWAQRLIISRDANGGVTVAMADGGDGLGVRFVN
jgi:hypothetical protein